MTEHAQHGGFRGLRLHAEFARQQVEELFGRKQRIEDVGSKHGAVERLQHGAQYSRLAATDFAGDDDDAFAVFYAVLEIGKDFQQALGSKQIPWVGRQAEWDVAQSVEFLIHLSLLSTEAKCRIGQRFPSLLNKFRMRPRARCSAIC